MDQLPPLGQRAHDLAVRFTQWPSVTGSRGEAAFPHLLAELLRAHPYFAAHPEHLMLQPIAGDPFGRSNVMALVVGDGRRAVTLSGHFDTVPTDDYGDLAPLATEPHELREAIRAKLGDAPGFDLARADLDGLDYLPGRGLLDMKSGLAVGVAVLERFAADPDRAGNLLLIATADEEDRSAGMRAAADALPGVLARFGLKAVLGINLDALIDNGDGEAGQIVAMGCVGKLLLSALVVGRDTHACYPLNGVNAGYLAAELVCELEFAPELGEEELGEEELGEEAGVELAAPPTVLGSRDLKAVYNVTTPSRVWTHWNVLSQRRGAAEVLKIANRLAGAAIARARTRMAERNARLRNPMPVSPGWDAIAVLSFAELRAAAVAHDDGFEDRFLEVAAALMGRPELDLPSRCRMLTELAWDASGLAGPAIVLGFASMPYPATNLPDTAAGRALEDRIRVVTAAVAARHGVSITPIRHLPVIVDMPFLGIVDAEDLRRTADNTPVWGSSIDWDLDRAPTPGIPMLNVGPWGRDYHHWLERVHIPYAFGVLPELVRELTFAVLE